MKTTNNKQGVQVIKIVVECPQTVVDFNQMELDLSDKTMKLKVAGAQSLVIKFSTKCLSTQAKAKFKKNKSLVVSIPIAN